jgi:sulfur-oxidizing protein SoxY
MPLRFARAVLGSLAVAGLFLATGPSFAQSEATWSEIRSNAIGDRIPKDGEGLLTLVTPKRAEDAAIVPIEVHVKLPEGDIRQVTKLTLVVDENPAPVVGTLSFPDGRRAFDLSLRVRVDSYSFVRAIAETSDGTLHMTKAYVKAAGGCSAPAVKDPTEALANLGQMRFRTYPERGEAQVQVRHPNYSGLQMDQITRLYTPAWYVENLSVRQGDRTLFTMEGGISISEDPTFRFSYTPSDEVVTVEAKDTKGQVFKQTFPGSSA